MKPWSVHPIRFLSMAICEKPGILTKDQLDAVGMTARRLLEFALVESHRNDLLIRSGIEAVCRTYQSNPEASEALLRRFLPQEHLKAFGYLDMPVLAREAGRLVTIAPALVRDMYISAFSFDESRTEQTSMGSGKIMPLTSNRRQDYDMARWQFGEIYPAFLKHAPEHAVEALVAVLSSEAGTRSNMTEKTLIFWGRSPELRPTQAISGMPQNTSMRPTSKCSMRLRPNLSDSERTQICTAPFAE